MKAVTGKNIICLLLTCILFLLSFSACSVPEGDSIASGQEQIAETDTSRFLTAITDEPDTIDFQCTTIYYDIALNVFNRLVETEIDEEGDPVIVPSLAESWKISEDGTEYFFHLRDNVTFSNGSPLTATDVLYSFRRLLTHPDSCNRDLVRAIAGADRMESGETDVLRGFNVIGDLDFAISLDEPYEAFMACLSMPGASILDEETVTAAGGRFGEDPETTIGTGPFILQSWEPQQGMILTANQECFAGPPKSEGLDLRFVSEPEEISIMFDNGELDILNLDYVGNNAEYYIHGDIYQDRLYRVPVTGIVYIALNESIYPLNDVRVRKALQMALNRQILLDAVYSGRGQLENGIYPHGLYGFNPELPEIPYDPEGAKALLAEAGLADGFEMDATLKATSTQWEWTLLELAVSMWEKIGVHAKIEVMEDDRFMSFRKNGGLTCYSAMWTADYNDPENFISTFFGSWENTMFRSLCYPDEKVMQRVRKARSIRYAEGRIREYRALEEKIVQEDAAWIPLFSRERYYVVSERVEGFRAAWNGSVVNEYSLIGIRDPK